MCQASLVRQQHVADMRNTSPKNICMDVYVDANVYSRRLIEHSAYVYIQYMNDMIACDMCVASYNHMNDHLLRCVMSCD